MHLEEEKLLSEIKVSGSKRTYKRTVEISIDLQRIEWRREEILKRSSFPHSKFVGVIAVVVSSTVVEVIAELLLRLGDR